MSNPSQNSFEMPTTFGPPEKTHLRLGFVALTDCAPLVAAVTQGFAARHRLDIELCRQPSWAAIRDKLLSGELDAAQCLSGLVYGVQLGLGGPKADMSVLMTLNWNGQAITLSRSLAQAIRAGATLKDALGALPARPVFAQTFPTGTHAMWLNYWLAANGLDPQRDVQTVVIPPPQMSAALAEGVLDGFCAGEPWHAVAAAQGSGTTVCLSSEIWPDHPEKVLACRAEFVALYPDTARALVMSLLEACRWLDSAENRTAIAGVLSGPRFINQPERLIAPRMLGHDDADSNTPDTSLLRFHAEGRVNFPYLSDGLWFLSQYQRWGMLREDVDILAVVEKVNCISVYREAAAAVNVALPSSTYRSSTMMDGRVWTGSNNLEFSNSPRVSSPV